MDPIIRKKIYNNIISSCIGNKCSFVLRLFVYLHIHMHYNIYAETYTHMYFYFQVSILLVCNLGSFRGEI